ncbi:spore protease YyaC [Paenibacillus harenae]|uniref:Sporulation protein YyaC n=1 Tax=Paenibacillus harenae TaxID=306543 RepID=A0ABT9UBZ0_PAEHA|nr:spore protease YyaC [Paenibacillus harenae]MDQ0115734.1 putative sporulation protein YyaC [Paenibacillus harenae]
MTIEFERFEQTRQEESRDCGLVSFFQRIAEQQPDRTRIVFVCIGTDRSTGDAFGPLVGTLLRERGWPRVIGTLAEPCDAHTVAHAQATVGERDTVIAIDACLGHPKSIGSFIAANRALQPGKAIGRQLPPVGHYSIAGVVNSHGPKAYWKLQTTSLNFVMQMAGKVAAAAEQAWMQPGARSDEELIKLPIPL